MQPSFLEWSAPAVVAPKGAQPWTEADYDRLTELYAETGGDIRAIAAKMGRSAGSIWTKSSYLGLAVEGKDVKLRLSLGDGCGKKFLSPDKGVRICSRCEQIRDLPWGVY